MLRIWVPKFQLLAHFVSLDFTTIPFIFINFVAKPQKTIIELRFELSRLEINQQYLPGERRHETKDHPHNSGALPS